MKGKSDYPLYPKCGIHWSKYGEYLAADSLIKYLEHKTNRQLPHIELDTFYVQDENKDGDYDIGEGMNLYYPMDTYPMAYPHFRFTDTLNGNSPKVLTVADSYYWGFFNRGMSRDCFNDGRFWYYNNEVYPDMYDAPSFVKDLDFRSAVEENDVILIITTDANLYNFSFGFVNQLYKALNR